MPYLRIYQLTRIKYIYGNMGVKRCVRTTGMQTNAIKLLLNIFNGSAYSQVLEDDLFFFMVS